MKKKIILLFLAFICSIGVWAFDVTFSNPSVRADAYGYGTRSNSNKTFTTNAISGLEGVALTVTGAVDHYTTGTYAGKLALKVSTANTDQTFTITAPDGYKITGYAFSAICTGSYTYSITANAKNYSIDNSKNTEVSVTGIDVQEASFTVNGTAANWMAVGPFTVTLRQAYVIYSTSTGNLYQNGASTPVAADANNYTMTWVSNASNPQVKLYSTANNISAGGRTAPDTEGPGALFANGGKTYTLSVPNNAKITGYTITGQSYTNKGAAGNDILATTTAGPSQTFTGSASATLTVSDKDLRSTSFTLTGTNAFLRPSSFFIYTEMDQTFVSNKSSLSNTKSYMVHGARGDWQYTSSEATSLTSTTTFNRTDNTRQIAFIKSATTGNYYAYSVITGKFITSSNTLSTTPEPIYIFETGNENYPFYFSFMSDKSDKNINLSTDFEFNYYNTYDEGNQWCLYAAKDFDIPSAISTAISDFETTHVTVTYKLTYNETILAERDVTHDVGAATVSPWATPAFCSMAVSPATVTAETTEVNVTMTSDLPFSISSTYDDANWYYLKLRGKYAIYGDTAPYSLTDSKSTALAAREKSLWAFVGNPFDGFRVVNKEAGASKYLDSYDATIQMGSTADGYSLWTVGEAGSDFTLHCGAKYLNDADEAGKMASKNNAGSDAGSVMAVEDVDYYNLSIALITELNSAYAITEDQCFGIRPSEKSAMEELLSEAFSANHSLLTLTVYDNTVKPAIIALLYPKTGRYYLIKNNYNNKYMHVTASGTRGAVLCDLTAEEAAKDVSAHFYITEKDSKPYLTTQGEYLNWVWGQTDDYEGLTATDFDKYVHWAIPTPGVGAFSIAYGNGVGNFSGYLGNGYYALKGAESTVVAGSTTNETSNLAQWTFEEVTTLTIDMNTVGSKSYATFCAPFDVTIGSGATAYQVDLDTERDRAVYSAITGNKVPAGAGVLLISDDAETSVTATIRTSGDAFSALVGNDLVGYKFVPAFSYPDETTNWNLVLGNSATTGIGFYKLNGTASPNKAYLPYPHEKSSSVKCLILVPEDDDETGIRTIDNGQMAIDNAAIYNLSGQRVGKLQKGINIVNGKKVIVK